MSKVAKLAKKWDVHIITTTHGSPTPNYPKHPMHATKKVQVLTKDFHSLSETWSITVNKQTGPHLDLKLESPRYTESLVGTLSADGKYLQLVGQHLTWTMNIDGDNMSGTGSARDNHNNHYGASCITMTKAK